MNPDEPDLELIPDGDQPQPADQLVTLLNDRNALLDSLKRANDLIDRLTAEHAQTVAALERQCAREREMATNANSDAARHLSRLHICAKVAGPVLEEWVEMVAPFRDEALTEETAARRRDVMELLTHLEQFL